MTKTKTQTHYVNIQFTIPQRVYDIYAEMPENIMEERREYTLSDLVHMYKITYPEARMLYAMIQGLYEGYAPRLIVGSSTSSTI